VRIEQKLSIPIAVVALGNIITGILKHKDVVYYLSFVGILFLLSIFLLTGIIKSKPKQFSIFLLFIAISSTLIGTPSVMNGAFFLCFSLYIAPNKTWIYWVYGGSIIVSLMTKYTISHMSISEMIVHFAGSLFVVLIYFHYIHPKPPVIEKIPGFTDDHMEILTGMITGKKPKEIADEMCLSDSTIRNKQAEMREKLNVSTNEQLIYHLWGILKLKNPT